MQSKIDGTVGKALAVLDEVAHFGRPVRFSDLLATSAYPKATLYRLLQTLTNQRMLSHDPDTGMYTLGVRLVRLAHDAWRTSSLAPIARPYLDALSEKKLAKQSTWHNSITHRSSTSTNATPCNRYRCIPKREKSAPPIAQALAKR